MRSVGCASALIAQLLWVSANSVTTCREKEKISSNSKRPGESPATHPFFLASRDALQKGEEVKMPTLSSGEALCEMGRRFRVAHDPAPEVKMPTLSSGEVVQELRRRFRVAHRIVDATTTLQASEA